MANRKRIFGRTRAAWARDASLALCFALAGCELVADFDRDKIPLPDAGPAATPDAGTPDAATSDAATPDAMLPMPGMDAATPDEDGGAVDVDAGLSIDAGP